MILRDGMLFAVENKSISILLLERVPDLPTRITTSEKLYPDLYVINGVLQPINGNTLQDARGALCPRSCWSMVISTILIIALNIAAVVITAGYYECIGWKEIFLSVITLVIPIVTVVVYLAFDC